MKLAPPPPLTIDRRVLPSFCGNIGDTPLSFVTVLFPPLGVPKCRATPSCPDRTLFSQLSLQLLSTPDPERDCV